MRILMLSQFFEPEPTFKGLAMARELVAQGNEVRVLTGYPNYPGGKLYPGYRIRGVKRELMEGIPITRVPLYPSHGSSRSGRVFNYVSFGAAATIYGNLMRWKPDVLYVYHPPVTTGIAGALISAGRCVPFVLEIQDLWPDTLRATGMVNNEEILRLVGIAMRWVYGRASGIIGQSPGFMQHLAENGVPEDKRFLVYNWCNEVLLAQRPGADWQAPAEFAGRFTVGFAGNLGKAQGLDAVLDAAALLQAQQPNILLFFVGKGTETERLKQRAADTGLANVLFLPAVPLTEIGGLLDAADALLVHLKDDPLFERTVPGKTQAYMFAGKPIVMAVAGDAADLVTRAGCGLSALPEDPRSIAETLLAMAALSPAERAEMGQRGRAFYEAHLSIKAGCQKMSEGFASSVS
jgi:colanic acid biosynthesis glycosyl transferase WcaI